MKKLAAFMVGGFCVLPSGAFAYRPFDSTDPAVADWGNAEIEFSPFSYRHEQEDKTWIGPAMRFNYGLAPDWEIVLEGQQEHSSSGRPALVENELSVKTVLREGRFRTSPE